MGLFGKRNVMDALRVLGVMMVILMLCFFIGTASVNGEGIFNWVLFGGFLLIYFFSAYMDGSIRGENECRHGERLKNQEAKTGKPLEADELSRLYSVKKGAAVAFMAAIPGMLLFLFAVVTGDNFVVMRALTRVYFTPYLKLFNQDTPLLLTLLIYFAGAVVYPALYFLGYLSGPRQHGKVKEIIRKNDEDYKKGIRRRKPKTKKRRNGFF